MIGLFGSIVTMLRVYLGAAVLLLILPWIAWPGSLEDGRLKAFWRTLLIGVAFWIAVGYLLSALGFFEPITLFLSAVVGVVVARGYRRRLRNSAVTTAPTEQRAMDVGILDRNVGELWRTVIVPAGKQLRRWAGAQCSRPLRDPYTVGTLAVLAASFGLRAWGPLHQVAPGSSDGYVHLLWTKEFMLDHPFYGGVYPEGMHAIAAAIATIFFINPLSVLRFIGPMDGLLMVLGVYTLTRETSGNRLAAITALAIFGLSTNSPLPEQAWRQMNDLPQEASAAFFGYGVALAWEYLRTGRDVALWLYGLCTTVELWIHPYSPAFATVVVGALVVGRWAVHGWRDVVGWRVIAGTTVAGIIGLLPLAIGLALGVPFFHSGLSFVLQSVSGTSKTVSHPLSALITSPLYVQLGAALGLAICVLSVWSVPAKRQDRLGLGLALMAIWLLYMAHSLGLPSLADAYRVGEFYSMLLCAVGVTLVFLGPWGKPSHVGASVAVAGLLVVPGMVRWPPAPPVPAHYEPLDSGKVYLKIERTLTPDTWTIISPVQQYSEVLGKGYHAELSTFLKQYPLSEAADSSFSLPKAMKTPEVFIWVQTHPIPGADVLEQKSIAVWSQAYAQAHPGTMTVYFRNSGFVVYEVKA